MKYTSSSAPEPTASRRFPPSCRGNLNAAAGVSVSRPLHACLLRPITLPYLHRRPAPTRRSKTLASAYLACFREGERWGHPWHEGSALPRRRGFSKERGETLASVCLVGLFIPPSNRAPYPSNGDRKDGRWVCEVWPFVVQGVWEEYPRKISEARFDRQGSSWIRDGQVAPLGLRTDFPILHFCGGDQGLLFIKGEDLGNT